jgi:hypothetical protein
MTWKKNKFAYNKRTYYIYTLINLFNHYIQENMWTKSHSIVTKEVTKEQMWRLFADVNNWHTWDEGINFGRRCYT